VTQRTGRRKFRRGAVNNSRIGIFPTLDQNSQGTITKLFTQVVGDMRVSGQVIVTVL